MMMKDIGLYQIRVLGHIDMASLNASGPLPLATVQTQDDYTHLSTHTDQSGLIGLLRFLHGLGYQLLEIKRLENNCK